MLLTAHFKLAEFIRVPPSEVPPEVVANLTLLCETILEDGRVAAGLPWVIHSGYRTPDHNTAIGGVPRSDHQTGRAADFHVVMGGGQSWEENTFTAFHWLRKHKLPKIGQLIIEDHREHYHQLNNPRWAAKLWVHVSIPSPKHPGSSDVNQLLVSRVPGSYKMFKEEMEGFA